MTKKILFIIALLAVLITGAVNISLDSAKSVLSDRALANIEVLATREGADDVICGILFANDHLSEYGQWWEPTWFGSPVWDYMWVCNEYVGERCGGATYNWFRGTSFCAENN